MVLSSFIHIQISSKIPWFFPGELSSSSDSAKNEATGSDEDSEFDEEELRKEFDDGYDAELVGDDEDRQRLQNMTEKEREQELYNRLEKREALEKRWEVQLPWFDLLKLFMKQIRNWEETPSG